MAMKKYKGVLILGKGIEGLDIKLSNTLITEYREHGYKVIGTAENGFEHSDLKILEGAIDTNTRIVINMHGNPYNGKHIILYSDEVMYTSDLLKILNSFGKGAPLNIVLTSCYAGLASKEVSILSKGSVFITHGLGNHPISADLFYDFHKSFLKKHNAYASLFEEFANEILMHSIQTSTISVSQGENKKPFTFDVKPNLKDLIKTPKETIFKIQTDFIKFYTSLNLKVDMLATREITDLEITKFQQGYFIYNCMIGNPEILELFSIISDSKDLSNLVHATTTLINQSPLLMAAQEGHFDIVKTLIEHKADVDTTTSKGATAVFMAAQEGHFNIVKTLLEHKADVDKADIYGATALLIAVEGGHFDIVKTLLEHKADVNIANNQGVTPITFAICFKHLDIANELISYANKLLNSESAEEKNIELIKKYCPEELGNYYQLMQEAKLDHHDDL